MATDASGASAIVGVSFTAETAAQQVRFREDAWNARDLERVVLAYTQRAVWRHRNTLLLGRDAISEFLARRWEDELDRRLVRAVWAFSPGHIAVRVRAEWRDRAGNWFRSHGNELWWFDAGGLVCRGVANLEDRAISEEERSLLWDLGVRPTDHPGIPVTR